MLLYHITKNKYLSSILEKGLKINSKKIGFCKKDAHQRYKSKYGMQPIFLTNDVEYICTEMLTSKWIKRHDAVVLKVDVELNEMNSSKGWYSKGINGVEPKEFTYFLDIEPKQIELLTVDLLKYYK